MHILLCLEEYLTLPSSIKMDTAPPPPNVWEVKYLIGLTENWPGCKQFSKARGS